MPVTSDQNINHRTWHVCGYELEIEDLHGMQRPLKHELWWDQGGYVLKVWDQGDYSYDGSGNITAIGGTPVKHYTYDGLNRLTAYYEGAGPGPVQDYSYDNRGNLERLGELQFTANSQNRLTTITIPTNPPVSYPVVWNGRGNLTGMPAVPEVGLSQKQFSYSKEDRLMWSKDVSAGLAWRFAYDAAGERVAAWQRASGALVDLTVFLRDEAGRVLSDWMLIPGVSFGPKRDYLYAGDRLAVQLDWSEGELPVRQYVAVDHLNSTRAIVNNNGIIEEIDYLPFGGFLTGDPQPDTTHLFTGHERDTAEFASNLDYMHARYFSPNLGRFLSVDPMGGEVGSSQSWNRYSYVLNSPVSMVDPSGEAELRITSIETGTSPIWSRAGRRGRQQSVPTYRLDVLSNGGQLVRTFDVTRDSIYNDTATNTRGNYSTYNEAPPGEYRGWVRRDGGKGYRIQLYEPGVDAGSKTKIRGQGSIERTVIQVHTGPGCSQGCALLPGGQEDVNQLEAAVWEATEIGLLEGTEDPNDPDLWVTIDDRNQFPPETVEPFTPIPR